MNTLPKRKILFVDDEKPWRDTVSASLGEAGFEVLAASDASEAMKQATDEALGLMIVDEDLGGESGIILTEFLRHNHPDVPVMLYTRSEQDPDAAPGMRSEGPEQSLPKGTMEELVLNVGCYFR